MFEKELWIGGVCEADSSSGVRFPAAEAAMRRRKENNMNENEIATLALDICFKIHKQYGPGLFESVYE
jgi:hypothetical protein